MKAPDSILRLSEIFIEHKEYYKSGRYNETQLRREFLDPFWKALGWDIDNKQGISDAYKDVIHEDSIKVDGTTRAPDYCFRIGGMRKFFVEAKKPSIDIKNNIGPAFQLRRYAWSAKLKVSVASDFEEFAVYDTAICPASSDSASVARVLYFKFDDYEDKWSEIDALFSRSSVQSGSLDNFGNQSVRDAIGYQVDDAFLEEIEGWRNDLAGNIALRNPQLSVRDLNFSVQKIIDRIVFLRICEDRRIEDYGRLKDIAKEEETYNGLVDLFRDADARFNSGLFHFRNEKGRESIPDNLTPNLRVDDRIVQRIVSDLYYPDSPYEFSVLPSDILGQVYERFLGKTIRFAANHTAFIEDKPQVRKAGGVFYTPTYIADYIVDATVGRLLNGPDPEAPNPISLSKAAQLKILDPACGSGSFLIKAYQYLLDWHKDRYSESGVYHSRGRKPKLYQTGGGWELTTAEKKRILVSNIFGVDIDPQAVEVTKLSLLLKVLEGETNEKLQRDFFAQHARVLPDLGNNICCGNSLIGPDYYDGGQMGLLAEEEIYRVNVFSWEDGFRTIMNDGGFDCVVGNPPWGAEFSEKELAYLRNRYNEIIVRMIDSFMYFVTASFRILKKNGYFGMILPDVFLYQRDNEKLRRLIFQKHSMLYAINAGNVFENVTRPTSIVIARNAASKGRQVDVADLSSVVQSKKATSFLRGLVYESADVNLFASLPDARIPTGRIGDYAVVSKIMNAGFPRLETFVDRDGIQRGVSPDLKEAFVISRNRTEQLGLEPELLKPVYTGGAQIKRYHCLPSGLELVYTDRRSDFSKCPNICKYIDSFRSKIGCKEVAQGKHPLYSLHRPRKPSIFEKGNKLLGVITEDEIVVAVDRTGAYATDGLYLFALWNERLTKYVAGVLNSGLFVFLYRKLAIERGRVLAQVKPTLLAQLPIPPIDPEDPEDLELLVKMDDLVDTMTKICERRIASSNPVVLEQMNNLERTVNRQIDGVVYDMYGLSEEDVDIVEGAANG